MDGLVWKKNRSSRWTKSCFQKLAYDFEQFSRWKLLIFDFMIPKIDLFMKIWICIKNLLNIWYFSGNFAPKSSTYLMKICFFYRSKVRCYSWKFFTEFFFRKLDDFHDILYWVFLSKLWFSFFCMKIRRWVFLLKNQFFEDRQGVLLSKARYLLENLPLNFSFESSMFFIKFDTESGFRKLDVLHENSTLSFISKTRLFVWKFHNNFSLSNARWFSRTFDTKFSDLKLDIFH